MKFKNLGYDLNMKIQLNSEPPCEQWRCNECDIYRSQDVLSRTVKVHKATPITYPNTPDNIKNIWACDICGKMTPTKAGISIHIDRMYKKT